VNGTVATIDLAGVQPPDPYASVVVLDVAP
jgi:hypothetical protein